MRFLKEFEKSLSLKIYCGHELDSFKSQHIRKKPGSFMDNFDETLMSGYNEVKLLREL